MKYNYELRHTIKEFGKDLSNLNLLIDVGDDAFREESLTIKYIIEGCPKLKTLTLESLSGWQKFNAQICNDDWQGQWTLIIVEEDLEALYRSCKELKYLNLTKVWLKNIFTVDEIKKILPDCIVEIRECHFQDLDLAETNDILDNFNGEEIGLMFSENYEKKR